MSWRRPQQIIRTFVDADEYESCYATVEEVMRELGRVPDPVDTLSRIRVVGSGVASLGERLAHVAESAATQPASRILAVSVLEQVEQLQQQVACLVVDLEQAVQTTKIAKGEQHAGGRPSPA